MVLNEKIFLFIIILLLFLNCNKFNANANYIEINTNDSCYINVYNIKISNGFIINEKFIYYSGSLLQKNNKSYKSILNEIRSESNEVLVDDNGFILLNLSRLKLPYLIYKNKNSNILYLVKNKDTIQFRTL